jgi:MGT family glycosyltransferase
MPGFPACRLLKSLSPGNWFSWPDTLFLPAFRRAFAENKSAVNQTLQPFLPEPRGIKGRKKILFANIPADGHFNPLTVLAVHLKAIGHDVRWYTGPSYAGKVQQLDIPSYLFRKAKEVTVNNIDEVFPERSRIRSLVKKLNFDICNYFILRAEEFFEDISDINDSFNFDILVADNAFTGMTLTRHLLKKQIVSVGVFPLQISSRDLGPTIMGLPPFTSFAGKITQHFLKWMVDHVLLREANRMMRRLHKKHGVDMGGTTIFDAALEVSSLFLQSGAPGFEYRRSDLSSKIRFVGPLLPYRRSAGREPGYEGKISRYKKTILVTQGTFEHDSSKLIVPALEAFKDSDYLIIVATAGSNTEALRKAYPGDNIVIEDYIPFDTIMPHADVFVSNGGHGGVMYSICNKLPMVTAGIHEGKNEICARVGYFKLGINLKTERPSPPKLKAAVEQVLSDDTYRHNVTALAGEFAQYDPAALCARYVEELEAGG